MHQLQQDMKGPPPEQQGARGGRVSLPNSFFEVAWLHLS